MIIIRLKVIRWKKTYHVNINKKKAGESKLISDEVDFRNKKIERKKEGHSLFSVPTNWGSVSPRLQTQPPNWSCYFHSCTNNLFSTQQVEWFFKPQICFSVSHVTKPCSSFLLPKLLNAGIHVPSWSGLCLPLHSHHLLHHFFSFLHTLHYSSIEVAFSSSNKSCFLLHSSYLPENNSTIFLCGPWVLIF